jgi:DNA-binding IclR family transcriptional regulator
MTMRRTSQERVSRVDSAMRRKNPGLFSEFLVIYGHYASILLRYRWPNVRWSICQGGTDPAKGFSNNTFNDVEVIVAGRDYTVPAIAKALDILEYIGTHDGATLQDVVRDLSLPKTSVYQVVHTLLSRGYLKRTRIPGGHTLGLKLFVLGNQAIGQIDIRTEATPLLYELMNSVHQTCHLGVLEGNEPVYLAKVDCPGSVAVNSWVGKRFSLWSTAMGKVLLAWRNPQEAKTLLLGHPPAFPTKNTITDVDEYLNHLVLVRMRQWALDDGENAPCIRCLAAPVFGSQGNVVGAVSITASAEMVNERTIPAYTEKLLEITHRLSEKIGYTALG